MGSTETCEPVVLVKENLRLKVSVVAIVYSRLLCG
ncbi:hypothetical protein PMI34_05214 [Pseudomonas sp. GM74]|nr:hypothetical protein PMI34_05214 [Pseudomonas sp. GM74]